jgi:hypothetical protein
LERSSLHVIETDVIKELARNLKSHDAAMDVANCQRGSRSEPRAWPFQLRAQLLHQAYQRLVEEALDKADKDDRDRKLYEMEATSGGWP